MRRTRAARLVDSSLSPVAHRIAGRDERPRPAWRLLGSILGIAMALWATGILELPLFDHRLVDTIGTLTILAVLVIWVRMNACSLAASSDEPHHDDGLHVRLIHSRRPSLDPIGAPDVAAERPRPGRAPS
jgi:hypothetical protein